MVILRNYKRGQLFLIEVIIAISVLVVLITALFAINTYTPPPQDTNLRERGNKVLNSMVETGLVYEYLEFANYSYYTLGNNILDPNNLTKQLVVNTVYNSIPVVANFKIITDRFNDGTQSWDQIDIVNYEVSLPTGTDLVTAEYYCPGFNGVFNQYRMILYLWYEVSG